MESSFENAKIAIALRTGRTALGWNQQEFATLLGVAKSTVARVETLEVGARADFMNKAIRLFKDHGVLIDLSQDGIPIIISETAIVFAKNRLLDDSLRRSDKLVTQQNSSERSKDNDESVKQTGIASLLDKQNESSSKGIVDLLK